MAQGHHLHKSAWPQLLRVVCVCATDLSCNNNASCDTESMGDAKKQPMSYCLWPTVDLRMQNGKQWLPLYCIAACNVKEMCKVSCRGRTRFTAVETSQSGRSKWKWQAPEEDRVDERCLQGTTERSNRPAKTNQKPSNRSFNNISQGSMLNVEL